MSSSSLESSWNIFANNNQYSSKYIGTESDKTWNGNFYFVQGADPQFGLMDMYKNPNYDPTKTNWTEEMRLAKLAVEKVNLLHPKPRFFVICGDLTNEFPTDGCPKTKELQIKDFKNVFSQIKSDIPLICVCGNHDLGDTPTVETIDRYRSIFGDDYFSFWCGGVFFIVLNSQYYKDPQFVPQLAEEQDHWLDNQLSAAAGSRIIVFSHIPWFLNDVNEEEDRYFNIKPDIRVKMLEKLYNAGVRHVFCGHCHKNAGAFYKELEIVITSAIGLQIGSDKSGLRIVKVNEDQLVHHYYPLEEIPGNILLT